MRERSLIFSWLKMSCFLKLMLLQKFPIRWFKNILNLFNISMTLTKCNIQWFRFDVTTRAHFIYCILKKKIRKNYFFVIVINFQRLKDKWSENDFCTLMIMVISKVRIRLSWSFVIEILTRVIAVWWDGYRRW